LKGTTIVNIGCITFPSDNEPQMVEDKTELTPNNPTSIGLALFANLGRAALLPAGMD